MMKTRKTRAGRTTRRPLTGAVEVPGDKSISHRALILAGLASGRSEIRSPNLGADVRATAAVLRGFGIRCDVDEANRRVEVEGYARGPVEPGDVLDCGNSGTTLRTLLGVAAGVDGLSVFTGDRSLRSRPMLRVVAPLRQMGARVDGRNHGDRAPIAVRGGSLEGIDIVLPVASAQVKTALLLAGLRAGGTTEVTEPAPSRDHTERMLRSLGVEVEVGGSSVAVRGGQVFDPFEIDVPGDVSSALYLVAGALLVEGSDLTVARVGLNPTRSAALDVLRRMGADLEWTVSSEVMGEPVGRIVARSSDLRATEVGGAEVPAMIDDLPVIAVVATQAEGETVIRDAGELRVKESDRISALAEGLRVLGADVDELPDGLAIRGPTPLTGGRVDPAGDHRIALSFAVAGTASEEKVRIDNWSCVDVSFPEFLEVLAEAQDP